MIESLSGFFKSLPYAFRAGVVVGGILSAYPLITGIVILGPDLFAKYPLELSFVGADMSERGVTEVVIDDGRARLTQTCREICDDVIWKFRNQSDEVGPSVTLLGGADRRVIYSESSVYADQVMAARYAYDKEAFQRAEEEGLWKSNH